MYVFDIRSSETPIRLMVRRHSFILNSITDADWVFSFCYRGLLVSHWMSMQPPVLGNFKVDLG
jgi:hypothetical protein